MRFLKGGPKFSLCPVRNFFSHVPGYGNVQTKISIPIIVIIIANPSYGVTQLFNASHPLSAIAFVRASSAGSDVSRSEGLDFDLWNEWRIPLGRGTKSAVAVHGEHFACRVTAKYKRELNFELVYLTPEAMWSTDSLSGLDTLKLVTRAGSNRIIQI